MDSQQPTAKIFVCNVTVLDCAIWSRNAGPQGRSWHVDVIWQGHTDDEGVVVDFSTAKKMAKKVIDDFFDHRLLISEEQVRPLKNGMLLCTPYGGTAHDDRFLLETYPESLAILPENIFASLAEKKTEELEKQLAQAIQNVSPENVTSVRVQLRDYSATPVGHFFNYLHSLRLHTGNCQRFHGHSNIVEIFESGVFSSQLSEQIARDLCGKYLVTEFYLEQPNAVHGGEYSEETRALELESGSHCWIRYSGSQGPVRLSVPKARLLLLPEESTIENISQWIHQKYFAEQRNIQVKGYEGLQKGALFP